MTLPARTVTRQRYLPIDPVAWAMGCTELDLASRFVLLLLARHADVDGTRAFPSVTTLVEEGGAGLSRSTIKRCLVSLEARGYIRRGDQQLVSHYRYRPVVWDLRMSMPPEPPPEGLLRPQDRPEDAIDSPDSQRGQDEPPAAPRGSNGEGEGGQSDQVRWSAGEPQPNPRDLTPEKEPVVVPAQPQTARATRDAGHWGLIEYNDTSWRHETDPSPLSKAEIRAARSHNPDSLFCLCSACKAVRAERHRANPVFVGGHNGMSHP